MYPFGVAWMMRGGAPWLYCFQQCFFPMGLSALIHSVLKFVLQEMCSAKLAPKSIESIPGLTTMIQDQSWPSIEIVEGLPEGKGVFARSTLNSGSMVCNYGGVLLAKQQGNTIPEEDSNYLMELTHLPWGTHLLPQSYHGLRVYIWKIYKPLKQTPQCEAKSFSQKWPPWHHFFGTEKNSSWPTNYLQLW